MKKVIVMILAMAILLTGISFAQEMKMDEGNMEVARQHQPQMKMNAKMGTHMQAGKRMMGNRNKVKGFIMGSFFLCPMAIEQLGLNDAQVDKLTKMKADFQKDMIDRRASAAKTKVDLKLLMNKIDMDIPAIQNKMQAIANMKVGMKVEKLKAFKSAMAVLTPEQKKKVEDIWNGKMKPGKKQKMEKMKKSNKVMKSQEDNNEMMSWFDMEEGQPEEAPPAEDAPEIE